MARITLPDGSTLEANDGITAAQVAAQIGPGLAKAAVAAKIDGQLVDLSTPLQGEVALQIMTPRDTEGLEVMRHSCAHIMAEAICRLWPDTLLVYGPAVEDGFYYDVDLDEPIRPTDFERIEREMNKIIQADGPFMRIEMDKAAAMDNSAARMTG